MNFKDFDFDKDIKIERKNIKDLLKNENEWTLVSNENKIKVYHDEKNEEQIFHKVEITFKHSDLNKLGDILYVN
jgi:hypothetical protein